MALRVHNAVAVSKGEAERDKPRTRVEQRRGGRVLEREELQLVDPSKLTVKQIAFAVRSDVLTLEAAYQELERRKAEGDALDGDTVPQGAQ